MNALKIEYLPKEELKAYCNNAKIHTAEQVEQIKNSIKEFGFNDPIAIWHDNEIVEGHGRLLAVMEMPEIEKVPIIRLDNLTDEQRRAYTLVHNKLTMNTDFDLDLVNIEIDGIIDIDMGKYGFLDFEADFQEYLPKEKGSLAEKFLVPPFSVIRSDSGEWLKRKRAWLATGIRSELGRGGRLVYQFPEWMERQSQMTRGE